MMIFITLIIANCLWKLGVLAASVTLYLSTGNPWYLMLIMLIAIPVVDTKEFKMTRKEPTNDKK